MTVLFTTTADGGMPSNQVDYREKMKRAGAMEAVGAVYNLVDIAVDMVWAVFNRPGPDGRGWIEVEGFDSVDQFRAHLALNPGMLVETCRDLLWVSHLLEEGEEPVLQAVVNAADALALAPVPRTKARLRARPLIRPQR